MSDAKREFEAASEGERLSLAQEFRVFLSENKKWWLLPILLVLGGMAVLAFLTTTGFAPFIYPML